MPEFVVEADGYGIEFLDDTPLRYENITLRPIAKHRDWIIKGKKERRHYKTCIAEVDVNDVDDCYKAIKESQRILDELSFYLAFAFDHDVFFQSFKCFIVESGSKKFVTSEDRAMFVGNMRGGVNVYSYGIQKFIDQGFSKYLNKEFSERTGIRSAILWYNTGRTFNIGEITLAAHFIALEILANCFADENPTDSRLPREIYLKFKNGLKALYQELNITEWEDIHNDICNEINRINIKEKISALLRYYDLSEYDAVARGFVDVRNRIFHSGQGDIIAEYGGWSTVLKQIRRLLVKLILKILDCYDMDELHSSIRKRDLLARA